MLLLLLNCWQNRIDLQDVTEARHQSGNEKKSWKENVVGSGVNVDIECKGQSI